MNLTYKPPDIHLDENCKEICLNYQVSATIHDIPTKRSSRNPLITDGNYINLDEKQVAKFPTLCDCCKFYKTYAHFKCKHHVSEYSEIRKKFIMPDSEAKKCINCFHLKLKDCPLLTDKNELLRELFKRLLLSLNIKFHFPNKENEKPLLKNTTKQLKEYEI